MKRYISVFEMIIRSSFYKVLGILASLSVLELGTFYIAMQQPLASIQPNLEELVDQSHFMYMFAIAYLLITVVLVLSGTNIGSMQGYTLQRLRIKEKRVFLLQCIYNILCYVLLWATQVGVLLAASNYYMTHKTDAILTNQTVFLAFHRNDFMHSILPIQDTLNWVLLFAIIVCTGSFAADFTRMQRRGKVAWILIIFVAIAFVSFPRGLEEEPIILIIGMIAYSAFICLRNIFYREEEDESEG